jgi:hypothetical protein
MAKPPKISDVDLALQTRKWFMCGGKVGFEDFAKADKRATELNYVAYECPYCNKYHLSKRKTRIQNANQDAAT